MYNDKELPNEKDFDNNPDNSKKGWWDFDEAIANFVGVPKGWMKRVKESFGLKFAKFLERCACVILVIVGISVGCTAAENVRSIVVDKWEWVGDKNEQCEAVVPESECPSEEHPNGHE